MPRLRHVVLLGTLFVIVGTILTKVRVGTAAQDAVRPAKDAPPLTRTPNELGKIPVLEYHLIGETDGRWSRSWQRFARDLELLHESGYRPISVRQLVRNEIDLEAGLSPVVITFDDASPGQFRYVERDGRLHIDSTSAVGVWTAFAERHPEWRGRGVFCVLPSATEGHAFFGEKGIQGQRSEWRHRKIRYLIHRGFEICNHTLWHANLSRMSDDLVREQIARAQLAVDSAFGGHQVRTLALPLGKWPKNRGVLLRGEWRDPRTDVVTVYGIDAVLMVAGGPAPSPRDSAFNPLSIPRVQVFGDELEQLLEQMDRRKTRYVSAGRRRQPRIP